MSKIQVPRASVKVEGQHALSLAFMIVAHITAILGIVLSIGANNLSTASIIPFLPALAVLCFGLARLVYSVEDLL